MASRYKNIKQFKDENDRPYLSNVIYPDIPASENDFYIITNSGDRYDILAKQYYNDSSLWWIIASANPELDQGGLIPTIGAQLRIPRDIETAFESYKTLNKLR